MATKIFDVAEMACEDVQAWVKSCKFGTLSDSAFTPGEVDDGAFVTLKGLADDTTYAGMKDWNVKMATAPAAVTDKVVVIDLDSVSEGVIAGNTYKIGSKLVDLKASAGFPVRYRVPQAGDMFWLGAGNFTSLPTIGQYAVLTANDTRLTPASASTANFCVAIRASKPMTIGNTVAYANSAFEQEYLVEVL